MKNKNLRIMMLALGLAAPSQAATVTAWWDFEDTNAAVPAPGDTIASEVGSTSAALSGGLESGLNVSGKFGSPTTGGIVFGSADRMVIASASAAATQLTTDFSIAMWVNPTELGARDRFIDNTNLSGAPGSGYRITTGGTSDPSKIQFTVAGNLVLGTQNVALNAWTLLIATYDVGGNMSIATIPVGNTVGAANISSYTTSTTGLNLAAISYGSFDTVIGSQTAQNNALDFIGKMDDVAIFSGVLSNEEIATIYNSGVAGLVPEPSSALLLLGSALGLGLRRRR